MPGVDQGHPAQADHPADACCQVHHQGGLLVDADHGQVGREQLHQLGEARLAHETAAGIQLFAAIVVVPVRDENQRQAVSAEEIQPGLPVQVLAHLVDLVNRQGVSADGNGRGAGQHQGRAQAVAGEQVMPGQAAAAAGARRRWGCPAP